MELTNTMANIMSLPDRKADYDTACKNVLAEKSILAWIMKCCLDEYRDCSISDIAEQFIEDGSMQIGSAAVYRDEPDKESPGRITGSRTEDSSEKEGTVYFDVKFTARIPGKEEKVGLIINVEAQKNSYPGYPLIRRGIFYGARMLSAQYETEFTESRYQDMKKVYSIWICMNPAKKNQNSITQYSIQEKNIVGRAKEKAVNYDLMTVIMLYLGKDSEEKILRLLYLLLVSELKAAEKLDILKNEYKICTSGLESGVKHMCNISELIEERGIERGIDRGIYLTKQALKLSSQGVSEQEIAEKLEITVEQVQEILK